MMRNLLKTALMALLLLTGPAPALAADKPLVMESGSIKQLPSATTLQLQATTTGAASINLPHGTAPSSPTNGDCWTTTAVFACRINGATASFAGVNTGDQFTSIANGSLLGNNSGATGAATALTGTQATALLDNFTSSLKGLAPASGGGTTNFLRADGSWAAPAGGGGGGSAAWTLVGSWDFSVSGAVATVDSSSLSSYNEVLVFAQNVGRTVAAQHQILVSTDGGTTYYNTSGNYINIPNTGVPSNQTGITVDNNSATTAKYWAVHLLNTKGPMKNFHALIQSGFPAWAFIASASDLTNVRVTATAAGNFNSGSIRIYAR